MKLALGLSTLIPNPDGGDATPGGAEDALLLEDSSGGYLMEDGATILMETAP